MRPYRVHMGSGSLRSDSMEEALAQEAQSWPFQEARRLAEHLGRRDEGVPVVFETGYCPSGLPHLGTFSEVLRTTMVQRAFEKLTGRPTRLLVFSDDMDGLRKVPDNIPEAGAALLREHLDEPLSSVPDPFGTHPSFAAHNNALLCAFLNRFGFEYKFLSATEHYRSGLFDEALLNVLRNFEAIQRPVLATLGPERRATYACFFPLCPLTGRVLQVPVLETYPERGRILYRHPELGPTETVVTGGACKLQWKADWAMRWHALGVDYEMAGKDLIESVRLSSKICRILGSQPPIGLSYELFLDEDGNKISKSEGNGLSPEEWLQFGPQEALAHFLYRRPRTAKKLSLCVIPREIDAYRDSCLTGSTLTDAAFLDSPVFHIHAERVRPEAIPPVSFSLLLNLVCAVRFGDPNSSVDPDLIAGFVTRSADRAISAELRAWIDYAIAYARDCIPLDQASTSVEDPGDRRLLADLDEVLRVLPRENHTAEALQRELYKLGERQAGGASCDYFQTLYRLLLGRTSGPRLGSFIAVFGVDRTRELIARRVPPQPPRLPMDEEAATSPDFDWEEEEPHPSVPPPRPHREEAPAAAVYAGSSESTETFL